MATTTNYGWTTPDDTALVKDGASAIRTLGSSVDTTTKALNPSTTLGDIEYRSSTANTNTRVGIGTSGQALTVVAGVPSWAASPTSTLTTTGDTLYASGANTLARLGVGSSGQVLTVSGGVPSWATPSSGGMTLISTTTLSGSTVTLSSIPQTYNKLQLLITGMTANTGDDELRIALNGVTNLANQSVVADAAATTEINDSRVRIGYADQTLRTDANNVWNLFIENYTSTTRYKPFNGQSLFLGSNGTSIRKKFLFGVFRSNTEITSIAIDYGGTKTFAGGTALLYGVK